MKLNIMLPIILLLPISITHADTRVNDSQQVCQERINGYKTALESAIKEKQNADAAKAQLDEINRLPATLSACEKQKRIPSLSNTDETAKQTNEAQKDRKISP